MGYTSQFRRAFKKNEKTVVYTIPKQGLLKSNAKLEFTIRALFPEDFLKDNMRQEIMKEISTGQKREDACRVVAERFKKDLMENKDDIFAKEFIQKGTVHPKIVDKEKDIADDELPYSELQYHWECKLWLIKEIAKISPMFEGIK